MTAQRTPGAPYWLTVSLALPVVNVLAFVMKVDVLHGGNHIGVPLATGVLVVEWLGAMAVLRRRGVLTASRSAKTLALLVAGTGVLEVVHTIEAIVTQSDHT
ncbi:MAG: hypothetical protein M3065_01490 [Actinomycetota bacterium]|nr:hypothetical protein [Actinomycetota bacterium]